MRKAEVYLSVSPQEHAGREAEYTSAYLSPIRCFASIAADGQPRVSAIWRRQPIDRPDIIGPAILLGAADYFPGFLLRDCQLGMPQPVVGSIAAYLNKLFGPVSDPARKRFHRVVSQKELGKLFLARGLLQVRNRNDDFVRLLVERSADFCSVCTWSDSIDQESDLLVSESRDEHFELARDRLLEGQRPAAVSLLSGVGDFAGTISSVWHRTIPTEQAERQRAKGLSNLALCLHRVGQDDALVSVLSGRFGRQAASYVVEHAKPFGATSDELLRLAEREDADDFRYYLLLALAGLDDDEHSGHVASYLTRGPSKPPQVGAATRFCARRRGVPEPICENTARSWQNSVGGIMIRVEGPKSQTVLVGAPSWQEHFALSQSMRPRSVKHAFALSSTEVTIEQFRRFASCERVQKFYERVNRFLAARVADSPQCPQYKVTYFDAILFCQWLSEEENIPKSEQCYPGIWQSDGVSYRMPDDILSRTGYRLPTEPEWELACRAGSRESRHYGSDSEMLVQYAQIAKSEREGIRPVGTLRPNEYGFHDMLGNVAEWCHEPRLRSADDLLSSGHLVLSAKSGRLIRGGNFLSSTSLSSATRSSYNTDGRSPQVGFRLARTIRE